MGDLKLSDLPPAAPLTGAELVLLAQAGNDVKSTPAAIATYVHAGAGTVTSVAVTSSDLAVTGSPVTVAGAIALALATQGAVTPGLYPNANVTVSAKGIVTGISAGTTGTAPVGLVLSNQAGIDKTGLTDSYAGFVAAYATALAAGVQLIVDCKCWVSITTNDLRSIFLRTGTYITGTPNGVLILDNSFIPTFILHHATDCVFKDLNIRYIGTPPWDTTIAPYATLPAHFNDVVMKGDMAANFGNTFSGTGSCLFEGTISPQSIFLLKGACARIKFINVNWHVPQGANAANFIGCVIGLDRQWTPSTLVPNNNQAVISAVAVLPTDIDMINCRIDGALMGMLGFGGMRINGLKSWRYSDMQKPDGSGAGGNALSFAPPHLIYLQDPDPSFTNWQRDISNVYDYGQYVGGATRRASTSGSLLSLKIAPCLNTIVDGYTCLRPDGFADILTNQFGNQFGSMKNLYFVYDSATVTSDALSIWGVRFPSSTPYNYLSIDGLVGRDLNPSPTKFPIVDMGNVLNQNCDFKGLKIYLNDWAGTTNYPGFGMSGNAMTLDADYYFNQYSSDTNLRGSFCIQGTGLMTNSDINARVHGWRLFPLVFAASPTGTSSALAVNWGHTSGTYLAQFSNNEVRYVTLTNGATTCTWAGALAGLATTAASGTGAIATITFSGSGAVPAVGSSITIAGVTPAGYNGTFSVTAAAPGTVSYANATTGPQTVAGTIACFANATAQNGLAANYGGYKQRMLSMQGGKGIGNRIRVMDVTNGLESICQNGAAEEIWTQTYSGTPAAGLTFDLPIVIPSTHNPDLATVFVQTALGTSGGLTSFALGWAATAAALLNTISPSLNTNPATAATAPITTNAGTSRTLRLTATGGTGFDGTGTVMVTVRCKSVIGAT